MSEREKLHRVPDRNRRWRRLPRLGDQPLGLPPRFFHFRITDFAIAANFFDTTQGFHIAVVAGAIFVVEVLDQADIPAAKLTLATVPSRHDAPQPAQVLEQVELPLLRAQLEAEIPTKDVELGTV